MTGIVSDPADGGGAAGLQRDAMRDDLAAPGQRRDRRIGAADAAAADGDEQIARVGIERLGDRRRIAPGGLGADDFGAGRAGAFRNQLRRHRLARRRGNIDDAQPRTAHVQLFQARRARDQQIERANAPPGGDDRTALGDIAAGAANALPRDRLRQHLNHRAGPVDGIGIDHAVATVRHRVAGLDPDRRCGQRQRRIGRRADEVAGAQRPAIGGGDVARRERA